MRDEIEFSFRDPFRKSCDDGSCSTSEDLSSRLQIEAFKFRNRFNANIETASARRIEAVSFKFYSNLRPHSVDERQKSLRQKIEGRRKRIVRAAFERER